MSLFGQTVVTTPDQKASGPRPPSRRPPTPWYRRPAVVVLAALAVALV